MRRIFSWPNLSIALGLTILLAGLYFINAVLPLIVFGSLLVGAGIFNGSSN